MRISDVSNPRMPYRAGFYNTPGLAYGVALAGSYAYVADDYAGLRIIDFYGGAVEERQGAQARAPGVPTIVRGVMRMAGSQTATLTDISGRDVLRLTPVANDIRHLAPGVYFVQSTLGIRHSTLATKVIVTQ